MNKPFILKLSFTVFFIFLYQLNLKAQNTYVDTTRVIVVVVPWQNGGPVKTYSVPNADGRPGVTTYISSVTPVKNTTTGSYNTTLPNTEKTGAGRYTDTVSLIKASVYPKTPTLKNSVLNSTSSTYATPLATQDKTLGEKAGSVVYTDIAPPIKVSDHPIDATLQNSGANSIFPIPFISTKIENNGSGGSKNATSPVKTLYNQNTSALQNAGANSTNTTSSIKTLDNSKTAVVQNTGANFANTANSTSSISQNKTAAEKMGSGKNTDSAALVKATPSPKTTALQNSGVNTPNKTTAVKPTLSAQNIGSAKQNTQQTKRDTVYIQKRDTVFIKQAPASIISNRSLFLEVGGPGLAISLNYDKRFSDDKRDGWGFRIGTGYFGDGGNTVFTIPFQVNYLIGSGSNFFELGAGTTFLNSTGDNTGKTFIFDRVTGFIGTATIGYRYQPETSSFNFRIGFVPIFSDEGITPAGGISIGYTFKSL